MAAQAFVQYSSSTKPVRLNRPACLDTTDASCDYNSNSSLSSAAETMMKNDFLPLHLNNDLETSISSSTSSSSFPELVYEKCNACPFCADVCSNPDCVTCQEKTSKKRKSNRFESSYTECELRRHNHKESAWLLCGEVIYDATRFIKNHPGGEKSIIRKSGCTVDCTKDMSFHSAKAVRLWNQTKVGNLVPCAGESGGFWNANPQNENIDIFEKSDQCVIS
mmetsp:Transcript_3445/g.4582  ORF Transcript_3445/g.4582 Transcript_3445/m.4582 type:complete len:221 (+) Transcript_3445:183-845(+)